jgi:hypothetical protein
MEPSGLSTQPSFEHLDNDDIINGEDNGVAPPVSTNTSMYNPSTKRTTLSGVNIPESAIKKSSSAVTAKDIEDSSLRQPLTSVNNETTSSLVVPNDTSDTVPIRTKAIKGGSLYGIMSQSAYRLAPAAVLLATAAAVMKNTRKHKQRKTRRTRR